MFPQVSRAVVDKKNRVALFMSNQVHDLLSDVPHTQHLTPRTPQNHCPTSVSHFMNLAGSPHVLHRENHPYTPPKINILNEVKNWNMIWLYPAGFAGVILILFFIGFKNENIEYQE